jgi:hypothetical protein
MYWKSTTTKEVVQRCRPHFPMPLLQDPHVAIWPSSCNRHDIRPFRQHHRNLDLDMFHDVNTIRTFVTHSIEVARDDDMDA